MTSSSRWCQKHEGWFGFAMDRYVAHFACYTRTTVQRLLGPILDLEITKNLETRAGSAASLSSGRRFPSKLWWNARWWRHNDVMILKWEPHLQRQLLGIRFSSCVCWGRVFQFLHVIVQIHICLTCLSKLIEVYVFSERHRSEKWRF